MQRHLLHALLALATVGCSSPAPAPAPADPAPAPTPEGPEPPANEPPPLPAAAGVHYAELLTAGAKAGDRLPMIVAIHGLGDTPRDFAGLVGDLGVPARVILPRALDPHEPGWSWFPFRAADPDVESVSRGIRHASDMVAGAISELASRRPTLGKPIVTGFSQGGILTFTLAVHHPEVVGAAFPVGGWLPPPLWPDEKPADAPPIQALHGTADNAVAFPPTKEAVDKLVSLGFDVTLHAHPDVGHAIPPPMREQLHGLLTIAVKDAAAAG